MHVAIWSKSDTGVYDQALVGLTTRVATKVEKLGALALIVVLFLPQVAILVVIGVAASWWLAAGLAAAYLAFMAVLWMVARSPKGFSARLLGVADYEPGDYSHYTPRNLFLRPLIVGLPAAGALIIVAVLTADDSIQVFFGVAVPASLVGYAAGGVAWSWMEKRRRNKTSG